MKEQLLVAVALIVVACEAKPGGVPAGQRTLQAGEDARVARLPEGVVARVAGADIDAKTVLEVARENGVAPDTARARAVSDALFAEEAHARLRASERETIVRAALGRALLEELAEEAARAPVTDAEVEQMTRERWLELDRPESARVTHAVALHGSNSAAARRVAEALREAVKGVSDPAEFIERAKAVPTSGVDVRAERLPAMTRDGRAVVLDRQSGASAHFDEGFARAANALEKPGEQSAVIETPFGFHVLLLEGKLPAVQLSLADRRRVLEKEIVSRRAGEKRRALVEGLRKSSQVEVVRDFDTRTAGLGEP